MDFNAVIQRAINIMLYPASEWIEIGEESPEQKSLLYRYTLFLSFIPALTHFIRYWVFGVSTSDGALEVSIVYAILSAAGDIGIALFCCWFVSYLVNALIPLFASMQNFLRSMQLVAYSLTPLWLASLLDIVPSLRLLMILFSFYGIYILYHGLPVVLKTPSAKVASFIVVIVFLVIFVYGLSTYLFNLLIGLICF